MLQEGPIKFYITKTVVNADQEKLDKVLKDFYDMILQINKEAGQKVYSFNHRIVQFPRKYVPSSKELSDMKSQLEENGYTVRKKRGVKPEEEQVDISISFYGYNKPSEIKELMTRWNELDQNKLNQYYLRYAGGPLEMVLK